MLPMRTTTPARPTTPPSISMGLTVIERRELEVAELDAADDADARAGLHGRALGALLDVTEHRRRIDIDLDTRRNDHLDIPHRHVDLDRGHARREARVAKVEREAAEQYARAQVLRHGPRSDALDRSEHDPHLLHRDQYRARGGDEIGDQRVELGLRAGGMGEGEPALFATSTAIPRFTSGFFTRVGLPSISA